MLVRVKDGASALVTEAAFRAAYPRTAFPAALGNSQLNSRGYYRVKKLPKPDTTDIEVAELGGPTQDVNGQWVREWTVRGKTAEELAEALAAERANMKCTRQQGKLALGPTVWASVLTMVDDPDTPWGLRVAIEDTVEWRRTDEDMQALVWAMGLTEEQADDLFRLAMTL